MLSKRPNGNSAIPSRNALRVLRNLALTGGSTVGNSYCTVMGLTKFANTYQVHGRGDVRKPVIDGCRRTFRSCAPMHDATAAAQRVSRMIESKTGWEEEEAEQGGRTHPPSSERKGLQLQTSRQPRDTEEKFRAMSQRVKQMQELLDSGRPIDAAQSFLDSHPASIPGLAVEERQLALKIFFVNCREDNVFMARCIFDRIEDVDKVSLSMWRALVIALARKGCIESVATLYERHKNTFIPPIDLLEIILRCLIESHRLTTAKWFLYRNLKYDVRCGLVGIFLSGIWKKTRSMELLEGQQWKILQLLPRFGKRPTERLFNPVLQAYVEFGKIEDAQGLVDDMQTKYGIPLSCRTKGLLVFSKALKCDWDGVLHELDEMHELGMTKDKQFPRVMDRIFLEYWVCHPIAEIRELVMRCIHKYELVPDKVLYRHFMQAYIEKGDEDMIKELDQIARERSWSSAEISEEEYLNMLRARRLAVELSPVGFWRMVRAARSKYGQAATSQQLLGYDRTAFPIPEVNHMPITGEPLAWYRKTLEERVPSRPVDQFQKLEVQMSYFMHVGKLPLALQCFHNAKAAGLSLTQLHLELAVIATLLLHGLDAAKAVIQENWNALGRLGSLFPVFFHQVVSIAPESEVELIKLAVFRFYTICRDNLRLNLKHHVTVATSRRLILKGRPDHALDLLIAVYKSRYGRAEKFDGTCMKMVARAFAAQDSFYGVRWAILTSLSRGSALNREIVVEARRIMYQFKNKFKTPKASTRRCLEYLEHITEILERKSLGDPITEKYRMEPLLKKWHRQHEEVWLRYDRFQFAVSKVQRALRKWDEEYELAIILRDIMWDQTNIAVRWAESNVLDREELAFLNGYNPRPRIVYKLSF